MKRIKKILPVLLGVMVLMFGTLTVSAASHDATDRVYWERVLSDRCASGAFDFIKENGLTDYKYIMVMAYSDKASSIYLSDCPFYKYQTVKQTNGAEPWIVASYNADNIDCRWVSLVCTDTSSGKWKVQNKLTSKTTSVQMQVAHGDYSRWETLSNYKFVEYGSEDAYIPASIGYTSFFPQPPVAQVATALPPVVQNQTKIILTIAIACLALLIILLVLPKKLPRFLNR